jgi:hypothetical protein
MAKTQEALLGEVVSLLRKQNALSTRDRLRESEEAKRQEKLTDTTTETSATTGQIIDSATDFQRRYLAGQAKTFTDKALGNKPTGTGQEIIIKNLESQTITLGTIKNILGGQTQFLEELSDFMLKTFGLAAEEKKLLAKSRLKALRDANENRLESINPQLAMAGGVGGALALRKPDVEEGEEEGGSGLGTAFGASALTIAGLNVMKKLKNAFKFIFGLPKKIALGLRLVGMSIFAKFLGTKSGKPFLKNIGKVRAWPIILAAMVANSFYSGIKSAFADDETGGNPNQDTASAEDQSLLTKVLDNKVFNTAMNAYLGFSVANFLTKGKLGASVAAVATAAWKGMKNARLGGALLRAMTMAGGTVGLGLSAPAWAAMLAAGLVWYHWDSISGALKSALLDPPATDSELLDAAALVGGDFDIGLAEQDLNMEALSDVDAISEAAIKKLEMQENAKRRKLKKQYLLKQGLLKKKANQGRHTFTAKDSLAMSALLTEQLLATSTSQLGAMNMPVAGDNMVDLLRNNRTMTPIEYSKGEKLASLIELNKDLKENRLVQMGPAGISSKPVVIAPVDNKTTNNNVTINSAFQPSWGGATAEAYERHTTFGGNGAGNWF